MMRVLNPAQSLPSGQVVLRWPDHPSIGTTLLAAVGTAGIFLGLGTLTAQGWVTWLGLVIAAGILASHSWRHREAQKRRAATRQLLDARLISRCRRLGGPSFMQVYYDGTDSVVLVLSDDALHIYHGEPLQIFSTIPLYVIEDASAGPVENPLWEEDNVPDGLTDEGKVLNLAVRMGGPKSFRLAFTNLERGAPPDLWAEALRRSSPVPIL
jgi:hypothetical protein